HSHSLLVPALTVRIRTEFAHVLDTAAGRHAELVVITELSVQHHPWRQPPPRRRTPTPRPRDHGPCPKVTMPTGPEPDYFAEFDVQFARLRENAPCHAAHPSTSLLIRSVATSFRRSHQPRQPAGLPR